MKPGSDLPTAPTTSLPRRGAWQAAVLVLALVTSAPALAAQARGSGEAGVRASAALDFRIVIPETVRFVRNEEQRDRTRQFTSRTVEVVDGRRVTTVARP